MSDTGTSQQSIVRLVVGVALGVLVAAAVIFFVVQEAQPQDCSIQLLEEATGERAPSEVDGACR